MKVSVKKLTDITIMHQACKATTNGKTSRLSLSDIYKCEHSPIRTQLFWIELEDIPTFVSTHLVRHKIGVEHYVKSNREDRVGYTGDLGRWQPVNHCMLINAQAIIQMVRKRLCNKAHEETRKYMTEIKKAVATVDFELAKYLVPECEYRNGYCPELKTCGRYIDK